MLAIAAPVNRRCAWGIAGDNLDGRIRFTGDRKGGANAPAPLFAAQLLSGGMLAHPAFAEILRLG